MARTGIVGWILNVVGRPLAVLKKTSEEIFSFLSPLLPGLTNTQVGKWYRNYTKEIAYTGADFTEPTFKTYPIFAMLESQDVRAHRYLLTFKATGENVITGAEETRYLSAYTMELKSQTEWTDEFSAFFVGRYPESDFDIKSVQLNIVRHKYGWTY
jgi:hypothetical protein